MQPDDLDRELSAAGDRARQSYGQAAVPDRAFGDKLRSQLLAQLPSPLPTPAADRGATRTGWALDRLFRIPRLAPLALAALLLMAAVVGARELYLGLNPDPTPTPVPSVEPAPSVTPEPTASPTATAEPTPTASPTASPTPSPVPTPTPTPVPTPKPTPKPTPVPTPVPIGSLSLVAQSCTGGVVLDWSKYLGAGFNHYTTLRNTVADIPLAYPPQNGAVDFGGTYAPNVDKRSAVDVTGGELVTYYYRTMAFNEADQVLAASSIMSAQRKPVYGMGALLVSGDATQTTFNWNPYAGPGSCFTYYKIVYSETNPQPAYGNDPYLAAIGGQSESNWVSPTGEHLVSGKTYYIRIQAIRSTQLGWFVSAQSDVAIYSVPPGG